MKKLCWFQHLAVMEDMLKDYLLGEHLLLVGNQGVGKNKIADRFLYLLNRPREYIQLHRYTWQPLSHIIWAYKYRSCGTCCHWAMHSIFYGQWIPTEVFSFVWGKKKNNKNLLAGCCLDIQVILERFQWFFNRKPTDFVKKSPNILECRRKK